MKVICSLLIQCCEIPYYSPASEAMVDDDPDDELLYNVVGTLAGNHLAPTDSLAAQNHPLNNDVEKELTKDDHNIFSVR
ncbi:hypothetical protein RYX36_014262 [Vicia faba]